MICAQPIVCYEFKKNARETVRATCQEFEGRPVVDLRSFRPMADGSLAPTPRGLTLQRSQLPELEAAVLALRKAVDRSHNES